MDAHDDATTRHAPPACTCCCHDGQVPEIGDGCDCPDCTEPQELPRPGLLRLLLESEVDLWYGQVAGRG